MAALFESEGKSDKAGEHHRRLAALEPYAAFSDSSSIDPAAVDTNAVRIDHLEWIPGQPLPSVEEGQPDWVASLGVDLSTDEDGVALEQPDESPPWLTEIERAAPGVGTGEPVLAEGEEQVGQLDQPASSDAIPEWMKEAGWGPSTGEVEETPVSFSDSEIDALEAGVMPNDIPDIPEDDGELAPAEIPNWLQDKAPPQSDAKGSEAPKEPEAAGETEGIMPDWLSEIADEAEGVSPDPTGEPTPEEPTAVEEQPEPVKEASDDSPGVPSWIDDLSPGATSTIITWLGDRPESEAVEKDAPTEAVETPSPVESGDEVPAEEIPSWLDDAADEGETREVAVDPTPSWLAGVAEAASQQASVAEETPPPEETPAPASEVDDDWLDNLPPTHKRSQMR
jgi:hypothetical protein